MVDMSMDEAHVVMAFRDFLEAQGWSTRTEADFVDVVARHRDGRTIYAEAKGHTSSPGLDLDTMYGQLLRRMSLEDQPRADVRYAAVVPHQALTAAKRVPAWVRSQLRIDIYAVHEDGGMELHGSTPLTDPDNFVLFPLNEADR